MGDWRSDTDAVLERRSAYYTGSYARVPTGVCLVGINLINWESI